METISLFVEGGILKAHNGKKNNALPIIYNGEDRPLSFGIHDNNQWSFSYYTGDYWTSNCLGIEQELEWEGAYRIEYWMTDPPTPAAYYLIPPPTDHQVLSELNDLERNGLSDEI